MVQLVWFTMWVCIAMNSLCCFIIVFQVDVYKCFYDDALIELGSHYANRTLFVECTKDYS